MGLPFRMNLFVVVEISRMPKRARICQWAAAPFAVDQRLHRVELGMRRYHVMNLPSFTSAFPSV